MKPVQILPLAALAAAWVIPDEQVMDELEIEHHHEKAPKSLWDWLPSKNSVTDFFTGEFKEKEEVFKTQLDEILNQFQPYDPPEYLYDEIEEEAFNVNSWLEEGLERNFEFEDVEDEPDHPPHHPPPGKRPHHPPGKRPHHPPGKRPGKHPHHPPHHGHGKPNETIYQLISKSKYTTKLAKLIDEYDELVELLNSTKANYTIFAPTDLAFKKIPEHAPKPSPEVIKKVLLYHVAPGLYPAGRVLFDHTVPTSLEEPLLGDAPQRIAARLSLRGVTLNFYSRVIAANIPATNGIIHGLDSILIPPPKAVKIIQFLPGEFSTLTLGLTKTSLLEKLNSSAHAGGTLFAPPNGAFKKLGPKINAFLFSKYGEKFLKALLEYHIVANQTLYGTAFVNKSTALDFGSAEIHDVMMKHECPHMLDAEMIEDEDFPPHPPGERPAPPSKRRPHPPPPPPPPHHGKAPRSYFHFDLPTVLGRTLAVDIARFGPFVSFKVNGFVRVVVQDGIAKDGVIQVVGDVLIPPRKVPGPPGAEEQYEFWDGKEMELEDFKERFAPFVIDDDDYWVEQEEAEGNDWEL